MIRINARQMAVFDAQARNRYEQRVAGHLKQHFARRVADLSEPDLLGFVRGCISAADRHGLHSERDVVVFAGVAAVLGLGFDDDPRFGWAQQILADPFIVAPSLRVDMLHERTIEMLRAPPAERAHA